MDIKDKIERLRQASFVLFLLQGTPCVSKKHTEEYCTKECEHCRLQRLSDGLDNEIEILRAKMYRDMN